MKVQKANDARTEIERLGLPYNEVSQFDLTLLSPDRRIQVREATSTDLFAPKDSIEKYAIQMVHSQFPPIVVTADSWIIDGNTRVGAALFRKVKFFPAIVLTITKEYATEKQERLFRILGSTLNSLNGEPLTRVEMRNAIQPYLDENWKSEEIARALGISNAKISAIKREIAAKERLGDSSVGLRGASLRALGATGVLSLNDTPYAELARLASDAGLNSPEISDIAKEAKAAGSDNGALDVLDKVRNELSGRISDRTLMGDKAKPPASRQLRQHLGFVVKFAERERELVETNPRSLAEHILYIERTIRVLNDVLALQKS